MVLPTAYLCGRSYFDCLMRGKCEIEVMESFEKQTFRNRCLIRDVSGNIVTLTVPVKKAEHKQLTRDIEISYQSRWQHQHWITLLSAYKHTPYFDYYADYLLPYYEKPTKWLIDLNDGLTATILQLLKNERPEPIENHTALSHTDDWRGEVWTDRHPWQKEISITDRLFEKGPETLV